HPGTKSKDDGVPEVPGDIHVRPRLTEVAPREAVREEPDRMRDRVVRRRDGGLREPENRPESEDDEPDQKQNLQRADAVAYGRLVPLRVRDDADRVVVDAAHS